MLKLTQKRKNRLQQVGFELCCCLMVVTRKIWGLPINMDLKSGSNHEEHYELS